jgi:hypothetical protein
LLSTTRARRGWSRSRGVANRHLDFQGDLDGLLAGLQQQRCLDHEQERVRRLYVGQLSQMRETQRQWQDWLERDIARAEGFGAPRTA